MRPADFPWSLPTSKPPPPYLSARHCYSALFYWPHLLHLPCMPVPLSHLPADPSSFAATADGWVGHLQLGLAMDYEQRTLTGATT